MTLKLKQYSLTLALLACTHPALASDAVDSDNDSFPDITESLMGTDPNNPDQYPGSSNSRPLPETDTQISTRGGFASDQCHGGFQPVGLTLCIDTYIQGPSTYTEAAADCQAWRSRVATYEDFAYIFLQTSEDAIYNPKGKWIGNFVDNNKVLCGNQHITYDNHPEIHDFEGVCKKWEKKSYWCVHDKN